MNFNILDYTNVIQWKRGLIMIFDALTYSILVVGAILTYIVFYLTLTKKTPKQNQEHKQ